MHPYLGDFTVGATVHLALNTNDLDAAPITLGGTPALHVYRDDGTTEDDSGLTLTTDYDSRTGLHRVSIDMSADGTFYATGHDYFVAITTGTVDGVSVVGKVVAHFSVMNRSGQSTAAAALTATVADSVPADGSRPSIAQGIYMLVQFLLERSVSGTTMTVYKPDGSTALLTVTLNDGSAPTAVTRAT
jgi:hypothetical protein